MRYIKKSPWIDIYLKLNSENERRLYDLAREINRLSGSAWRSDAINGVSRALSTIIANILRIQCIGFHHNIQISLKNDSYPMSEYNPNRISVHSLRKVIDFLRKRKPPYIEVAGGNYNRKSKSGYPTQFKATDEFINYLINIIGSKEPKRTQYYPITRKTFCYNDYHIMHDSILESHPLPLIRLREGSSKKNSKPLSFSVSDETQRMEGNLRRYNDFIQGSVLDIFVSDAEFPNLLKGEVENIDDFGERQSSTPLIDLVSGRGLYRVFNDGRFDHGGRFYGGWWQGIPRKYRRFITIDGIPTVEVDFSGMQIAMLYAKIGQDLEGDAYAINGIGSNYRDLIKTTTLKLINNVGGRMEAPRRSELPDGMTWKELQNAIRERHAPIASYFGSGEGIRLQRLDSDIAEDVMMSMLAKGTLALPIHDSFIVAEGHEDELRAIMPAAYKRIMGDRTIGLKRDRSLFDDLLNDRPDLTGTERHQLGMERFHELKQRLEYDGYRKREEWACGTTTGAAAAKEDCRHSNSHSNSGADALTGPRAPRERIPIRGAA